jgi:PiT family inorganic phosphate transporter
MGSFHLTLFSSDTTIYLLTLFLGFYMAWNIGANDVANAIGTSVGSKALSLRKAVLIAAILEFSGAFFLGSNVSQTIQKEIIDPTMFAEDPMIFILGMVGSLFATGAALQLASYFGAPVSTTHAIVGAVLGFGISIGGVDVVNWHQFFWIVSSWILSPLLSGIISYALFSFIQRKILFHFDPFEATQKLAPYFVFLCFTVISLTLVSHRPDLSSSAAMTVSCSVGGFAAIFSKIARRHKAFIPQTINGTARYQGSTQNAEEVFISLQLLSACLVAFAHGANDVANAIGPVAAVVSVLKTKTLTAQSEIPSWLLAIGGMGIVVGLATWGWRVIETVGKKITELTPTRGFAAEFGAATTILLASKLGLPISTTHALIGAVLGVGLSRGLNALNLQTLKEIIISWVITIPLCAALSIIALQFLKFFFK